jgi:DNA anti-recombination protein RmuC
MQQLLLAILVALTSGGGLVAWRNSTIDKRKSVTEQMSDLADQLRQDRDHWRESFARLEADAANKAKTLKDALDQRERELQQQLAEIKLAASHREQQLQEQITTIQREATQREQALQSEIAKLYRRITEYTEEIDVLRKQIKAQEGDHK